ncbi:hypothetical protein [Pedobacter agri]|uniref:hypothetical protein n=1 Tax=Pedobacter agri TaxID=454586 RepID=UPI002930CA0A|nr:hypothetical protein [Pedobacter agri]
MEIHPRIKNPHEKIKLPRIILGSFPTWHLSSPDLDKKETFLEKETLRIANKDMSYFFGSSKNKFWDWYGFYVDGSIDKKNEFSLISSLKKNEIGITDVILGCIRTGKSALDQHLRSRIYNHDFFAYPKSGQKLKILCTSKGVMNEMLLNRLFFDKHPSLKMNIRASLAGQERIKKAMNFRTLPIKSFFCSIEVFDGGTIECFAIPSPGSPFRKLKEFGLTEENNAIFLNEYLKNVFIWFLK